ncbi:MAG: hypothetical protein IJD88_08195 [Clostridia bacterium]|nr:hypothetical protein [Clostridia bacterium]
MNFKNKFITKFWVPFYLSPYLPFLYVEKLFNKEKKLISLSENDIGNDEPVFLTAHRGVTAIAPENTIPAYKKAVELGYYSAECDIRLTKDNKWVLIHNDTVDKLYYQFGPIGDFTLQEAKMLKHQYGSNFWKKEMEIATLEEFLDVFVGSDTRPQIEIKEENYDKLYTVIDAIKSKGLEKTAIIISFDLEQLKVIHELDSSIELWYLIGKITEENIREAKAIGDNVWLSPGYHDNDEESIKLAVDAKIGLSFWTVNKIEDARKLYNMGVRYIESDILCK